MKYDVDDLLQRQFAVSEHYRKVFTDLENVRTRTIDFGTFHYVLQYNPCRIGSATADTKKKVTTDNCFLCEAHRFPGQIALEYDEQYNILVNPYPIFRKHLTIVDKNHVPQEIIGEESKMVQMAEDLPGFTVFYNSRHSGASAPFHRHFQACETKELPVFCQWDALMQEKLYVFHGAEPFSNGYGIIYDGTRYMYLINTRTKDHAIQYLTQILRDIQQQCNSDSPEANVGIAVEDGNSVSLSSRVPSTARKSILRPATIIIPSAPVLRIWLASSPAPLRAISIGSTSSGLLRYSRR